MSAVLLNTILRPKCQNQRLSVLQAGLLLVRESSIFWMRETHLLGLAKNPRSLRMEGTLIQSQLRRY